MDSFNDFIIYLSVGFLLIVFDAHIRLYVGTFISSILYTMDNIYEATPEFNFNHLSITSPTSISGGIHFSKLLVNKLPLYIQTPKCKTKQGIVKSGKKMYTDLVFTNENEEFIQWLETLEITVRKMIYDNRTKWFDVELTEEDVENYFTQTVKLFKSGKMYLVRVNANSRPNGSITVSNMKIYDENEQPVNVETINDKTEMITIIEFQGVRCSSKSFQIDIELKQIMILKPVDLFQRCIIKSKTDSTAHDLGNVVPVILEASRESLEEIKESTNMVQEKMNESIVMVQEETKEPKNILQEKMNESIVMSVVEEPTIMIKDEIDEMKIKIMDDDVLEVNFDMDDLEESDTFHLKEKTEVYYEMYREARRKAKLAKSLALSSFMEARRIKNLYMLDDVDESDSDLEDFDEDAN
jgi:hypothetical protein